MLKRFWARHRLILYWRKNYDIRFPWSITVTLFGTKKSGCFSVDNADAVWEWIKIVREVW